MQTEREKEKRNTDTVNGLIEVNRRKIKKKRCCRKNENASDGAGHHTSQSKHRKNSVNRFFAFNSYFKFQTTPDSHRAIPHRHADHAHVTNFMINKINRICFGCHRHKAATALQRTPYLPRTTNLCTQHPTIHSVQCRLEATIIICG